MKKATKNTPTKDPRSTKSPSDSGDYSDFEGEDPTLLSILTVPSHLNSQIQLTDRYETCANPAGFKNIILYPHQAVIVHALIELEQKKVITLQSPCFDNMSNNKAVVESQAIVISEPFGSGKTIIILALVLSVPVPRAISSHVNHVHTTDHAGTFIGNNVYKYSHEVTRRYTSNNSLIRPNLIVVGSSVLVQWQTAIAEFTNLRCFTIGDYYSLKEFQKLYTGNTGNTGNTNTDIISDGSMGNSTSMGGDMLNRYDIILLKNGKVTGNFQLPGEVADNAEYHTLITMVAQMTSSRCWSRVVYDDFDTIAIPTNSINVNCLSTIYVSATRKKNTSSSVHAKQYKNIQDVLLTRNLPLTQVTTDNVLFTNFNLKNSMEFTEASTGITKINGFKYVFSNPNDNYMRLLGTMGDQNALEIMEMLNGDAVATAAETMGIKTTSVANIFQRMLDIKYDKYLHDQHVLTAIGKYRENKLPELDDYPNGSHHTMAELEEARCSLVRKCMPATKYYSEQLVEMVNNLTVEYQLAKEIDGKTINRVISNVKEGMCQICTLPLALTNVFIVKCCGLIVCDVCGIKGNQLKTQTVYTRNPKEANAVRSKVIMGACANCKAPINAMSDLIFLDSSFDISSILTAVDEDIGQLPTVAITPIENEVTHPKLRVLRNIILGITPKEQEPITINIEHLLKGQIDVPQTKQTQRKVIIFANFNETLDLIENFLVEQSIVYLRLSGTYRDKANIVASFKMRGSVLLINSHQHCAGLHLAFCSDLVYFHKITDPNIESQVAGRIQRIGRTSNANIHYLLYKNENYYVQGR